MSRVLSLIMVFLMIFSGAAYAAPVLPSLEVQMPQQIMKGDFFQVVVSAKNVSDLYGADIALELPNSELMHFTPGTELNGEKVFWVKPFSEENRLIMAFTLLAEKEGLNGDVKIGQMVFRATEPVELGEVTATLSNSASYPISYMPVHTSGDKSIFPDMTPAGWYESAVYNLFFLNVVNGYPDGTFKPNELITRAEASKMLALYLNIADGGQDESIFPDVTKEHWAGAYITSLAAVGLLQGYPDGTFKPEQYITRAEAAVIISRSLDQGFSASAKGLIEDNSRNFSDVAGDHWAKEAIDKLAMEGILKGYPDHTFRPDAGITRAEFAVLLSRIRNFSS